jgi:hypothetical protein
MMGMAMSRRAASCALAAAFMLVLADCASMPGKFTSALDIMP